MAVVFPSRVKRIVTFGVCRDAPCGGANRDSWCVATHSTSLAFAAFNLEGVEERHAIHATFAERKATMGAKGDYRSAELRFFTPNNSKPGKMTTAGMAIHFDMPAAVGR